MYVSSENPIGADNQQETKARRYTLHAPHDTHVVESHKWCVNILDRALQAFCRIDSILCRDPQRLYARPLSEIRGDDIVRSSWRHGESGRNDLTCSVWAVPHIDITEQVTRMPKVAKFLVG